MNVIISAKDVTIEDWSGIGYIIMNPETGAGAYQISGGLNGGSSPSEVYLAGIVNTTCSIIDLVQTITLLTEAIKTMAFTMTMAGGIAGAMTAALSIAGMLLTLNNMTSTFFMMFDYLNGDLEAGEELVDEATWNVVLSIGINAGGMAAKNALKNILQRELVSTIGSECTERLLKEFGDVKDLSKCVKRLLKMDISAGVIIEISEKFGKEGLEWILRKQSFGMTDDLVRKILQTDSLDVFTDSVLYTIQNSTKHADDIIEQIIKYGEDAANVIVQYGEDAVEVLVKYGEPALKAIVKYGQDAVDILVQYGDEAAALIKQYDNVATEAIIRYGDDALDVFAEYGDEAAEGFRNGKTPDEVRASVESGSDTTIPDYTPYTPEMRKYIIVPKDGHEAYLERIYIQIRQAGFDDIPTIAKNTGISEEELYKLKKHVFLDTHMLSVEGAPLKELYFQADSEIAYAWNQALNGELSQEGKEWFEQLVKHELTESQYMEQGLPLRDPSTYINGSFVEDAIKNAHDKANLTAPQPGDYPGHDWGKEFLEYVDKSIEY